MEQELINKIAACFEDVTDEYIEKKELRSNITLRQSSTRSNTRGVCIG